MPLNPSNPLIVSRPSPTPEHSPPPPPPPPPAPPAPPVAQTPPQVSRNPSPPPPPSRSQPRASRRRPAMLSGRLWARVNQKSAWKTVGGGSKRSVWGRRGGAAEPTAGSALGDSV